MHESFMRRAIALSCQGVETGGGPFGAVVVKDGEIIGEGMNRVVPNADPTAHAEVVALRAAALALGNYRLEDCTLYVTLEPCAHHGRTGPCCDVLIDAGIAKVVASVQDPNPQVAGLGFARLRAAGIQVDVGLGAQEAKELNIGFFKRMEHSTTWLRMKSAQ